MYKTYVISYDPVIVGPIGEQFVAFIQSNATTYQFFCPFLGTVLVKSAFDLHTLNGSYNSFFARKPYFLAELDPKKTAGRLAPSTWQWINAENPPAIPYTPVNQ